MINVHSVKYNTDVSTNQNKINGKTKSRKIVYHFHFDKKIINKYRFF